jgi:hypothetical protein
VQTELLDSSDSPDLAQISCETCGERCHRTIATINVTKASYVDGSKRFDKFKKKNAILKEMYNVGVEKRGEFKKELKQLEQKEKVKS